MIARCLTKFYPKRFIIIFIIAVVDDVIAAALKARQKKRSEAPQWSMRILLLVRAEQDPQDQAIFVPDTTAGMDSPLPYPPTPTPPGHRGTPRLLALSRFPQYKPPLPPPSARKRGQRAFITRVLEDTSRPSPMHFISFWR